MKSMWRLFRGELYKMWKSKILVIMVAILCAVIIVMGAIYSHYDKQVSGMISMMLGGDTRVTAFDLLDGKAEDLLKEAGISPDSLQEFQDAFDEIQRKPEVKSMLVTVTPAVVQEMADLTMPDPATPNDPLSAEFFDWVSGHTANMTQQQLVALASKFAQFGSFAPLQTMLQETYLTDYIAGDDAMNARMRELSDALINDGAYGKTVVGFIEEQLDGFYRAYKAMTVRYDDYKTKKSDASVADADKYQSFVDLLAAFYAVATEYSSVKYFTKSNAMSTNFLLIPVDGFISLDYQTFSNSLSPFESNVYKDTLTNYGKVLKTKSDDDAVNTFKEEFLSLLDPAYEPADVPETPYNLSGTEAATFVAGVESLISSISSGSDTIFAYDSAAVQDIVKKVESGTALNSGEQKVYDKFKSEDGAIEPLLPAKTLIRSSYSGVITKEIYDTQIRPYVEDKEKPLIDTARQKIKDVQTRYTDAALVYGLVDNVHGAIADEEYASLYGDYSAAYAEYASRTSTAKNLIINVNLIESIEANDLKDKDAKKIQGFMMSSRYTLRSEVTKAQYLISSNKLANEFVAMESLGSGWGAMQFIFVLSSIVILVFGIVLAAGAIAGEHSNGTMKLLLIRPHRRWQVLISKFLAVIAVIVGLYLFNYLFTFAIGGIFWGLESLPALSVVNSVRATALAPAVVLVLQHLFGMIEAIIFAQISLTLSTVIKSRSGAVSVSMLVYFVSFVLSALLSGFGWYKFILFNNTNLTQYFTSTGPSLADMTLGFSLGVNVVYIVVLAVLGLFTFAKRDAT